MPPCSIARLSIRVAFAPAPLSLGMFNAGGRPDAAGSPRRGHTHVNPAYLGRRAAAPSAISTARHSPQLVDAVRRQIRRPCVRGG